MIFNPQEQIDMANFINENAININYNVMNESTQLSMSDKILDRMFSMLVTKYNKVDFTDIEKTKGNIERFKYFNSLQECINTLCKISEAGEVIPDAITLSNTLSNLRALSSQFEHGFKTQNAYTMMIYNIIGYALFEATSYTLAGSIEFVKNGQEYNVEALNLNTSKKCILISSLEKFNKSAEDGTVTKYMKKSEEADKKSEVMNESAVPAILALLSGASKLGAVGAVASWVTLAVGLLWLGAHIIPLLRELVYLFYRTKHSISETAKIQADFLLANIEVLKNNNGDAKVIAKQIRVVEQLRNVSRKFALDYDKSDRDAKIDIKEDVIDVDDLVI